MLRQNNHHLQQSVFDTDKWMNERTKQLLSKSWAPTFYEEVFQKINEQPFGVLFKEGGRPNFPINILLSLEYIKHMNCLSDEQLLNNYNFDYLVNYAVGNRQLGSLPLAPRTLYYFRERLYRYTAENPDGADLLFSQFLTLLNSFVGKTGTSMSEQRMDTTMFMSNIKKAGRMSLAYDVLVVAIKEIPGKRRTAALNEVLDKRFKTDTLYRLKDEERTSRFAVLLSLCKEALEILRSIRRSNPATIKMVERFLGEQTKTDENGNLVVKEGKEVQASSLQSAYDTAATFRNKAGKRQSGYVLEIAETTGKENAVQFITDYSVEKNVVNDVDIIQNRVETIKENTGCNELYVDGGFYSPEVIEKATAAGINTHFTDMTGTDPKEKLPLTEYEINENDNIITKCPSGELPMRAAVKNGQSVAYFDRAKCENCPLKDKCKVKIQKKEAVMRIHEKSIIAAREREKIKQSSRENTSKRAGIEGTNSALKHKGLGKLDVRGEIKSAIVCAYKVTAQNINRCIRFAQGKYTKKPPIQGNSAPNFA